MRAIPVKARIGLRPEHHEVAVAAGVEAIALEPHYFAASR